MFRLEGMPDQALGNGAMPRLAGGGELAVVVPKWGALPLSLAELSG
jgi:hypothetical protein